MNKYAVLLFYGFVFYGEYIAQTENEIQVTFRQNDSIFSKLHFYQIAPSLYYGDRQISLLNGKKDTLLTPLNVYYTYKTFLSNRFSYNSSPLNLDSILNYSILNYPVSKSIPVIIAKHDYVTFKDHVFDSNYVVVENNVLKETTNDLSKIYDKHTLFIAGPLVDLVQKDSATVYSLSDSLIFFDTQTIPSNYSIEFKLPNESQTFTKTAPSDGINKKIEWLCQSDSVRGYIKFFDSKDTLFVHFQQKTYQSPSGYIYFTGRSSYYKGRIYIDYGCNNNTGKILKPFLFVEGFDPGPDPYYNNNYGGLNYDVFLNGPSHYYACINTDLPDGPCSKKGRCYVSDLYQDCDADCDGQYDYYNLNKAPLLINKLKHEGFDIIYFELQNTTLDIEENAEVLIKAIGYINANKTTNHKIILAGGSMGGLLTKIALNKIETTVQVPPGGGTGIQLYHHQVRDWITFDTPHSGANIPLGDQYFVDFFGSDTKPSPSVYAKSILNTTASLQMLFYHYNRSTSVFDYFYNKSLVQYFPTQIRRSIALSNGSNIGSILGGHQGFGWGALMVDMETCCNGFPKGKGKAYTYAVSEIISSTIFKGTKELCNISFINPIEEQEVVAQNFLPIDNAPGGYRLTNKSLVKEGGTAYYEKHCFVPTISALAIQANYLYAQSGKYDFHIDLKNKIFLNPSANYLPHPNIAYVKDHSITPFDVLYAPSYNQQHVEITDDNINFIMNQISPADLYLQNEHYTNDADVFEARNTITAGYSVTPTTAAGNFVVDTGSDITFRAGTQIVLKPGFHAKAGSKFHAYIDPFPCPPVFRLANDEESSHTHSANYPATTNIYNNPSASSHYVLAPATPRPLSLIPNPANSSVHLQIHEPLTFPATLKLINSMGTEVFSTTLYQNTYTLSLLPYPPGLYVVLISAADKVFQEKLMVEQ